MKGSSKDLHLQRTIEKTFYVKSENFARRETSKNQSVKNSLKRKGSEQENGRRICQAKSSHKYRCVLLFFRFSCWSSCEYRQAVSRRKWSLILLLNEMNRPWKMTKRNAPTSRLTQICGEIWVPSPAERMPQAKLETAWTFYNFSYSVRSINIRNPAKLNRLMKHYLELFFISKSHKHLSRQIHGAVE